MKVARNYRVGGTIVVPPITDPTPDPEVRPQFITTTIKFTSAPTSAIATRPLNKFNKKNWLSLEWDDASAGAISGLQILNNAYYTDGCGNNINYRAALAINGGHEFSGTEYTYDGTGVTGLMSTTIMKQMIAKGWDISDHSYYHDPVYSGANITPYQNTVMMQDYIKRLLNYWCRTKVVPTNYAGHATAARDLGYLYSTSQGTFDSFTPEWMYAPPGNYATLPAGFAALRRDFTDVWTDTTALKNIINTLLASTGKFFRIGSHTIDVNGYQDFINYISTRANDQLLVATTREILEYREIGTMPTTQTLQGDTLTITTDLKNLDTKNRWKDQTFSISSDKQVASVTSNVGTVSFNPATGLVNTFLETI